MYFHKVNDILEDVREDAVEAYVKQENIPYKAKMMGYYFDDSYNDKVLQNIEEFAKEYYKKLEEEKFSIMTNEEKETLLKEKEMKELQEKQRAEKELALHKILISSGFNFDGHKITKYYGYISGDDVVSISKFTSGKEGRNDFKQDVCDKLALGRRNALKELKEAAYDLGCNAIIGVDFDYISLESVFGTVVGNANFNEIVVTANGNAVVIEKDE